MDAGSSCYVRTDSLRVQHLLDVAQNPAQSFGCVGQGKFGPRRPTSGLAGLGPHRGAEGKPKRAGLGAGSERH